MNKMFTAVAVLQLVQAGRVRLDAPVGTYLRDYPNRDVASRVTIHQLLTHTGGTSEPETSIVPRRAVGYMRAADDVASNAPTLPFRGTSAGGGYSTVGDLLRFATALREQRLLDRRHTALLTAGKVETPIGRYAYGFFDMRRGGARMVGHGGGAPGMNGDLAFEPDSGYVVVALSNLDPPAAQRIADLVLTRAPAPVAGSATGSGGATTRERR
jgi:CubicO group peptidase (beta-lactamase class C family)